MHNRNRSIKVKKDFNYDIRHLSTIPVTDPLHNGGTNNSKRPGAWKPEKGTDIP